VISARAVHEGERRFWVARVVRGGSENVVADQQNGAQFGLSLNGIAEVAGNYSRAQSEGAWQPTDTLI